MTEHDKVDELLGAYLLGSASPKEAALIRRHLPTCAACRESARRLMAAAESLSLATEEVTPPKSLRRRILAAAAAEGRPSAVPLAPTVLDLPPIRATRRATAGWADPRRWVPAAAAAALFAGLLGWNVHLQSELASRPVTPGAPAVASAVIHGQHGSNAGSITYLRQQRVALVTLHGLASPSPGRTYELWLVDHDGTPHAAGLFLPEGDGSKVLVVPEDISSRSLAVTEEPVAGSARPTSAPILTGGI